MNASRRELVRRARALLARAGYAVVALVMLLGIVRGGSRYFYCPMMGQSFDDACCASAEHDDDATSGPSVERPDCCQAKRLGKLPSGAAVSTIDVPAVPVLAVLPPFDGAVAPLARKTFVRFTHPSRAGPPTATERRAMLMVWTS